MKDIFRNIYKNNIWGSNESFSGTGSSVEATREIIQSLPDIMNQFQMKSILDAPCGDFNWMKYIVEKIEKYIGVDVVPEIIEQNKRFYRAGNISFLNLDITVDPLPQVDVIFCRDCLVHFSYQDIWKAISNFKRSSSTYLLTTSFTGRIVNADILTGEWRPVNFEIAPFNFPMPKLIINEKCTEGNGQFADKSLVLWRLDEIHL